MYVLVFAPNPSLSYIRWNFVTRPESRLLFASISTEPVRAKSTTVTRCSCCMATSFDTWLAGSSIGHAEKEGRYFVYSIIFESMFWAVIIQTVLVILRLLIPHISVFFPVLLPIEDCAAFRGPKNTKFPFTCVYVF